MGCCAEGSVAFTVQVAAMDKFQRGVKCLVEFDTFGVSIIDVA